MDGQGGSSGGGRAPRLRVPDTGSWKLGVLKKKDDHFHSLRGNFELQVGSVLLGLKPLLALLRDTKVDSAEHFYSLRDSKLLHDRLPPGSNDADWSFELIGNKLFMVFVTYFFQDPKKVVSLDQNYQMPQVVRH